MRYPKLVPGGDLYIEAFWSLSNDRQMTMGGSGPIPFTSIDRYASRYGLDSQFEFFESIIRDLDQVYLVEKAKPND